MSQAVNVSSSTRCLIQSAAEATPSHGTGARYASGGKHRELLEKEVFQRCSREFLAGNVVEDEA